MRFFDFMLMLSGVSDKEKRELIILKYDVGKLKQKQAEKAERLELIKELEELKKQSHD